MVDGTKTNIVAKLKAFISASGMEGIKFTINDKSDLPTFAEMTKSFGTAMFKTGVNIVNGDGATVSEEEKEARLDICRNCDYFNHIKYTCNKCSCKMKYKSVLKNAKCPIGKW